MRLSDAAAGDHRPQRQTQSLSLARTAGRFCRGHFGAERVIEFERAPRDREALLHPRVILGETAHHAAIFERQAVRIFKVDRLSPLVIDDVGDLYPLGAQFVALLRQASRRAGLEGKVIEAGGNASPRLMPAS